MLYLLLLILQLVTLYLTSKRLINLLFNFLFRLTRSKKFSFYTLALLFLPGTLIHELSHFLVALVTLVPVGTLHLWPHIDDQGGVRLGSVAIGKTDPIRRGIVGIAPIVGGTLVISGLILFSQFFLNLFVFEWVGYLILGYLIFVISTTMFSSKKDLEGIWLLVFAIVVILVTLYIVGIFDPLTFFSSSQAINLVNKANTLLLIPFLIDLALVIFLKVI